MQWSVATILKEVNTLVFWLVYLNVMYIFLKVECKYKFKSIIYNVGTIFYFTSISKDIEKIQFTLKDQIIFTIVSSTVKTDRKKLSFLRNVFENMDFFTKYWYFDFIKVIPKFPQNFDIYVHLDKKLWYQINLKNVIFQDMLRFSEIWLFVSKESQKYVLSFRNVDTYVDMEYSELVKHSKTLTSCGGAWKWEGWETLYE